MDLTRLGLWSPGLKNELVAANGSVADLDIPADLKALYKTVWEIKQRVLVDMAAGRGAFIDQSQSFNVHMADANYGKLTSLHFYAWKAGLKTGMYYLRTRAAADAIKFTVDQQALAKTKAAKAAAAKGGAGGGGGGGGRGGGVGVVRVGLGGPVGQGRGQGGGRGGQARGGRRRPGGPPGGHGVLPGEQGRVPDVRLVKRWAECGGCGR